MRMTWLLSFIALLLGLACVQANGAPFRYKQARVRIPEEIAQKMVLKRVDPVPDAHIKGEGSVRMNVLVGVNGDVERIDVLTGHPMLFARAIDAVRQWKFEAYYLNGKPVRFETTITLTFAPSLSSGTKSVR